jgi:hypothetical protein
MGQHNEKSQANSISHILLNMEMKVNYAVLEIPTEENVWTWDDSGEKWGDDLPMTDDDS